MNRRKGSKDTWEGTSQSLAKKSKAFKLFKELWARGLYQSFEKACGTMAQEDLPDGNYVFQQDGP